MPASRERRPGHFGYLRIHYLSAKREPPVFRMAASWRQANDQEKSDRKYFLSAPQPSHRVDILLSLDSLYPNGHQSFAFLLWQVLFASRPKQAAFIRGFTAPPRSSLLRTTPISFTHRRRPDCCGPDRLGTTWGRLFATRRPKESKAATSTQIHSPNSWDFVPRLTDAGC